MNNKFAILSKMLIKGKYRRNFESYRYGKSGAIGEAEAFVIIFLEDSPCLGYIFISSFDDIDYFRVKHFFAEFNRLLVAKTLFNQIQSLNNYKICGCQWICICFNKLKGVNVESVIFIFKGIIGRSINHDDIREYREYHLFY